MIIQIVRLGFVVLAFTLACLPLHAQISSTAPLTGVVQDPSGAVIPGVSVTARNNATSAQFETLTIENGTFVIPALTPGFYTVTVKFTAASRPSA